METPFSIVIPAYREERRLEATLRALIAALHGEAAEIVVVDDGSDDKTAEVAARSLRFFPKSQVIRFEQNRGKGAAIRAGALASSGNAVVYMDADLATDLESLASLLGALEHADFAVGSRTVVGARTIGSTRSRAIMAHTFNRMARRVSGLPIRDTQCGFKAIRREAANQIFGIATIDRFAFDVELLTIARKLNMTIVEVPVTWTAVEGSSVRLTDPIQMTLDLVRIARRCREPQIRLALQRGLDTTERPRALSNGSTADSVAIQG